MMFKPARGLQYEPFLDRLHARLMFDWYLEVGCRTGRTFGPVKGKTIAVDPFFRVEANVIGPKPALHIFQQTSDDFFASGFLEKMGIKLSFSFLDGMHLCEYLLRDFIATEAASDPKGVIALHDCCPFGEGMMTRVIDPIPKGAWTGDVWKLIPILQEYRPDLKLTVVDCWPTGLVFVTGLNPESRVLQRNYDRILAKYQNMTMAQFGYERFAMSFEFVAAEAYINLGFPDFEGVAQDPASALQPVEITP